MPHISRRLLIILAVIGVALEIIHSTYGFIEAWREIKHYFLENFNFDIDQNILLSIFAPLIFLALVTILVVLLREKESRGESGEPPTRRGVVDVRAGYLRHMKLEVKNRLDASLHGAVLIDLQLDERQGAALPWHFLAAEPQREARTFANPYDAFAYYGKRILILGDPGSGKTTTLQQIARRMIDDAVADPTAPIPLLVNLSDFEVLDFEPPQRDRLPPWLRRGTARERQNRHIIQQHVARLVGELRVAGLNAAVVNDWIESRSVALILDGLDEVDEARRPVLVSQLNETLLADFPDVPTIVASRVVEYQMLERSDVTKLRLDGAVVLQPLSPEQTRDYLERAKAQTILDMLETDPGVRDLAANPLTLSIMVLTYQGREHVPMSSQLALPERRRRLFDDFVDRMMQRQACRKGGEPWDPFSPRVWPTPYSRDTVNHYAGRLAVALSQRMATRFQARHALMFFATEVRVAAPTFLSAHHVALMLVCALCGALASVALSPATMGSWYWPALLGLAVAPVAFYAGGAEFDATAPQPPRAGPKRFLRKGITALQFAFFAAWCLVVLCLAGASLSLVLQRQIDAGAIVVLLVLTWFVSAIYSGNRKRPPIILPTLMLTAGTTIGAFEFPVYKWSGGAVAVAMTMVTYLYYREEWDGYLSNLSSLLVSVGVALLFAAGTGTFAVLLEAMALSFDAFVPPTIQHWIAVGLVPTGIGFIAYLTRSIGAFVAMALTAMFSVLPLEFAMSLAVIFLTLLIIDLAANDGIGRQLIRDVVARDLEWALLSSPILVTLVCRRDVPWRFWKFLDYLIECLLLRRSDDGFSFVHLLLRDYFAVRQLAPALYANSAQAAISAIQQLAMQGDAGTDPLKHLLTDERATIRSEAIAALVKIPSPAVAPIMLNVLRTSQDRDLRLIAVNSAARASPSERRELLSLALADSDAELRLAAIPLLYEHTLELKDDTVLNQVIETLTDPDDRIVGKSALAIGGYGITDNSDDGASSRLAVLMRHLQKCADRLAMILAPILEQGSVGDQIAVARFIGTMRLEEAALLLVTALRAPELIVRQSALGALLNLPKRAAMPAAISASTDVDADIRERAITILSGMIAEPDNSPDDVAAITLVLRSALTDTAPKVRVVAIAAELWFAEPDIVFILERGLADADRRVRAAAFRSLAGKFRRLSTTTQEDVETRIAPTVLHGLGNQKTLEAAAQVAYAIRSPPLVEALRRCVRQGWSRRQLGAVTALGYMGAAEAIPDIAALLARTTRMPGRIVETMLVAGARISDIPGPRATACVAALHSIGSDEAWMSVRRLLSARSLKIRLSVLSALLGTEFRWQEVRKTANWREIVLAGLNEPDDRPAKALVAMARLLSKHMPKLRIDYDRPIPASLRIVKFATFLLEAGKHSTVVARYLASSDYWERIAARHARRLEQEDLSDVRSPDSSTE